MPFEYQISPTSGPIRQGEILADVWEHRVELPCGERKEAEAAIRSTHHGLLIVLNQDCDLAQDYEARFSEPAKKDAVAEEPHPGLLPHLFLSDLFEETEVRGRISGSDLWRRIKQNQDERYHRLPRAPIKGLNAELPEMYMDFKKTLGFPTRLLYEGIFSGGVVRRALLPPVYLHDVIHRFFSFQSRVALP